MPGLTGQVALVTGASSGIGEAIATALAAEGASVCLAARRRDELERVLDRIGADANRAYPTDLTDDRQVRDLVAAVETDLGRLDVLVHCAGTISVGSVAEAPVEALDNHYSINLRARYLLTQATLPMMLASQGQIVFVNSSVGGRAPGPGLGQYAATQHALRAIADSLRAEVNPQGVRVLSVFPGRTATPMQARLCELEGKAYSPERLIQPEDIASTVIHALTLPRTAEITEISIRPFVKPA